MIEITVDALTKAGFPYDGAWLMVESGVAQDYADQLNIRDTFTKIASGVSKKLRLEILLRDNFHCRLCGRGIEDGVKLEIDHINPRSKGGKTMPDNLWTLCFDCNRGKSARLLKQVTA